MKSDIAILLQAFNAYKAFYESDTRKFLRYVGITNRQWDQRMQTGKLQIRPAAHDLLVSLKELSVTSPHFRTMFIMVEIKHGKRANNE